ncbi:MAG: integrase domain-containing protein [Gammaproteobacteria bacterium]
MKRETLPEGDRWTDDPFEVIQNLWISLGAVRTHAKVRQRYFIVMLELMYWLGLRPREAAFFNPGKDIRHDAFDDHYCFVAKQGSKGGRERKVLILERSQKVYLKELQTRVYCRHRIMPKDVSKTDSWMRAFNRFCVENGLSKDNQKKPYSLRHEYAQRTYEHISGQPSPIRPSVAGAYIG